MKQKLSGELLIWRLSVYIYGQDSISAQTLRRKEMDKMAANVETMVRPDRA